jgi:hypothetical protein
MSVGSLGVATVVLAVVAAALTFGLRPAVGGPVVVATADGPYKLTLTIPHASYVSGQHITGIIASLEYTGGPGARITHSGGGPINFAVAEVGGPHKTEPIWDFACRSTDLIPGQIVTAEFRKTGAVNSAGDPDAAWTRAYLASQALILDPGGWTITAIASFSESGCTGPYRTITVAASIDVGPATSPLASPGVEPSPTLGTIDGLPLLTLSQAIAQRSGTLGSASFALTGYWSALGVVLMCAPPPSGSGVLEIGCYDGMFGITELPEPIVVMDQQGYTTPASGARLTPWIPADLPRRNELFGLPVINGQSYPPVPIVLVGHFRDAVGAADCRPEVRQTCLDRLVVERIVSFDAASVPTPGVSPSPTPFPSPAPSGLFGPDRCSGDIPYSFVGWTTTQELHIQYDRPGHVWAMVTRDVIKLTEGGWLDDPNGSGHQFQIWGQRVCLAEEDPHNPGPATTMEFAWVEGTVYVLWDDGLRTPGGNPIR